jgi:YjbE family integral membrane protein
MPIGQWILPVLQIVWIDLLLAGDNALVIAMAVRSLPPRERRIGTALGAAAAVALRVGITFVAAQLLNVPCLKLAGGLFVLWIALKVMADVSEQPDTAVKAKRLLQAIWYIVFADLTMSTDNVLAVAGASGGSFKLILFGLGLSIPFVVFSANLLAELMNRYPITIYLGAGILGRVGGEMILTDSLTVRLLHRSDTMRYLVEGALAVAVMAGGKLLSRKRPA